MQEIQEWMQNFSKYWKSYEIEKVLSLFTENVEYFESPYEKFKNFDELREAWEYINTQKNIIFEYTIFSCEDEKYMIDWYLEYEDTYGEKNIWQESTYSNLTLKISVIILNKSGKRK